MDLPRPPRLIPRSPWNFYQFLSSDVPRSFSLLKFPKDPDDSSSLFLHRTFIVFLRDCLPYPSLSFSRTPFTVPSSLIFFLHPRSSSCHPPGLYYRLLHARFLRRSIRLSVLSRPLSSLANPVISDDFSERLPPSTPPSRIPARDNPYKLEH